MSESTQQAIPPLEATVKLKQEIKHVFEKQKIHALELRKSTAKTRIAKIKKLHNAILDRQEAIYIASYEDFKKPEAEVDLTDIFPIISEANHTIKHLKKWMKPVRVMPTKATFGTRSYIRYEPMGVNLIIAPWNYPINLMLVPLISAIAAGNTAILKPSEMTPHAAAFLHGLIKDLFDESEVALFKGDSEVSKYLLSFPFDHIFFTGSPTVGKTIMEAAAKHLSKVTLELGGKSPAIIDKGADIREAAKNLAFSKYVNNGQTCIAPDYVYVHEDVKDEFAKELKQAVNHAYGDIPDDQLKSSNYARIVNAHHHNRIKILFNDALRKGARIEFGGHILNNGENYISPTMLTNIDKSSRIMKEEIFGPLLPVLSYKDINTVIDHINKNEKPLALYIYTNDQKVAENILNNTSSGDACINTSMMQYLHSNLPFGGVNNSGIGKSHGIHGFRTFSHERSVLINIFSPILLFAPPYSNRVKWLIKSAIKYMS